MSSGDSGVIHTKSSYAEDLSVSITNDKQDNQNLLIDAYIYLYDQEKAFYQSFFKGVTTLDDFLERVRKIFNDAESDREYLKRFTNARLSTFEPNKELRYFERGLKLIVDIDKGKEIFKNFKGKTKDMEFYGSGTISINIDMENVSKIRHILNVFSKRSGNSLFKEGTNAISQNLIDALRHGKFNADIFKIVVEEKVESEKKLEFDIRDVSKESFNKDRIEYLKKHINEPGNREQLDLLRREMAQSLKKMENFMFSQLSGCSEELRDSVRAVWKEVVPEDPNIDILEKTFFFEGNNIIKALYGNPGEFANAVFLRYLDKKSDTKNPVLTQIIGNIFKGGEQPRSDIQVMTELGASVNFQTKNIEDTGTITTNSTLELILPNFTEEGIADILVNHFANTTYGGQDDLTSIKELLSERFYHAMNLNVREGLDELQTNTFYFVGGDKLIPGSKIIKHIYLNPSKPSFEITGKEVKSDSDKGYKDNFKEYFYWKYEKGSKNPQKDEMISTSANKEAFAEAQKKIRISTSFSINALITSHNFSIFN